MFTNFGRVLLNKYYCFFPLKHVNFSDFQLLFQWTNIHPPGAWPPGGRAWTWCKHGAFVDGSWTKTWDLALSKYQKFVYKRCSIQIIKFHLCPWKFYEVPILYKHQKSYKFASQNFSKSICRRSVWVNSSLTSRAHLLGPLMAIVPPFAVCKIIWSWFIKASFVERLRLPDELNLTSLEIIKSSWPVP